MKKTDRKFLIKIGSYLFWGGCTTVINVGVFIFLRRMVGCPLIPANVLAWILAVLFAFITNRRYVFSSSPGLGISGGDGVGELVRFVGTRLFSGVLDMALMYLAVSWAGLAEFAVKIAVNAIVIAVNYAASALFVFKTPEEEK